MDIGIIVAFDEGGVIGKGDKLPWRIPKDMQHFKDLTMGHPVIMGRKTYESIPERFRPLDGRLNVVLSRSERIIQGAYVVKSLGEAIDLLDERPSDEMNYEKVYIAGGRSVYEEALSFADFLEVTHVNGMYEGDVYFPEVNWDEWEEKSREDFGEGSFACYRCRK